MVYSDRQSAPAGVRHAVTLLWWSLTLGGLKLLLDVALFALATSSGAGVTSLLVTAILMAFLIRQVARGASWARTLLLLLFVVGVAPFALVTALEFERSALLGVVSVLQLALQLVALSLLFRRPQSAWFRRGR